MSDFISFVALTPHEADAYLERFKREMASSLDKVAVLIGGEPSFSRTSLDDLWTQAVPSLTWRPGYEPPAPGQPGRQLSATDLENALNLPSWFHHPSSAGYARFSADTLWLIDGLARYLGETAVRRLGGTWAVGRSHTKGYMFQNQPVLSGVAPDAVSPMQTCAVLAARALSAGQSRGPQSLTDVYDIWSASAGQ